MEKNKTTYPNLTLCDTTYIPNYEEYKEYCEENYCEPQSEDSQDYWDYVSDRCSMEWNMEIDNEKDGFLYFDGDFDLPTKMIQQIEDLPDRRLRLAYKKDVYEQRMYSLVLRQLSPIQKGVQTTHSVVEYANNYGCDEEYRQWAETDKTLIILDGGTFQEMEDIHESLKEWGVKFSKFQEPDLNYLTTAITFLVDERVWNRVLYPSWENLPQYPLVIDGNVPTPDPKDYMSYNEWVEMMGGAVNVDLRKLIFSKKLSM